MLFPVADSGMLGTAHRLGGIVRETAPETETRLIPDLACRQRRRIALLAEVIGGLLPLAVVVAISATSITVVILMLLSGRRPVISVVFGAGYLFGIAADTVLFVLLGGAAGLSTSSGISATAWFQTVVGVLLILFAFDQWSKRPRSGEATVVPRWMAAMDEFTVVKSISVSLVLSALRPKNVLLFAAAAVVIGAGHLGFVNTVIAVAVFAVVSASTVLALIIASLVREEKMRPWLTDLGSWLEANARTMISAVLLLIGVVELGKGIGGIF